MLNITKSACVRKFQMHFSRSNRSWIDTIQVQNVVRAKKSFAFEPNMRFVLNSLRQLLTCTESKAYSIYDQFPTIRSIDMMDTVGNNIEILMKNGVASETIIENPFLLVMNEGINDKISFFFFILIEYCLQISFLASCVFCKGSTWSER